MSQYSVSFALSDCIIERLRTTKIRSAVTNIFNEKS